MSGLQLAELWLIGAELAVGAAVSLWFVAAYWRSAWGRSPAGRHLMAVAVVTAGEFVTLLLMLAGVGVPLWVFAAGYGLADAVLVHRLVLYYRARRVQRQRDTAGSR